MKKDFWHSKDDGNIADLMATCIFILSMTVLMFSFMEYLALIQQKAEVTQLARRYILRMEAAGGLEHEDRAALNQELSKLGVDAVEIEATGVGEVSYGEKIWLEIRGLLGEKYEIHERKVSTAKH